MNSLIDFFKKAILKKKTLNKLMVCLIIFSAASKISFYAENTNELSGTNQNVSANKETDSENESNWEDAMCDMFSNMYKKFKNFFSIDEKKIYKIIKKLEKTKIKDEFEKYNTINVKTSDDVINYHEKTLNIIIDEIKEYSDDVSLKPSGNASNILKDYLLQVLLAVQLSEKLTQNDKLRTSVENIKSHIENVETLKDFRDVSSEILDVISIIKSMDKIQSYHKLIYRYNKNIISKVNKCSEYSYDVYVKERTNKKYENKGQWLLGATEEHTGYINYDEKENTIFIAFRGTNSSNDLKTDISFTKEKCSFLNNKGVHSGFLNSYNYFKPELNKKINEIIKTHPNARIIFTGHSLGGAVATLAALDAVNNNNFKDKNISLITFCSPRVLSEEAYKYCMSDKNIKKLCENTIRIWRAGDVVSSLPFEGYKLNFKHFGKSWCIDKLPDNYKPVKKGLLSVFSYSEWVKWGENYYLLHSMTGIRNDIRKVSENKKVYIDKIKIDKNPA